MTSTAPTTEPLLSLRLAQVVRAAHQTYFPAGGAPDPVPRLELVFSDAKREMRRLIRIVLWALELSPIIFRFSRFSKLTPVARAEWLRRLGRSKRAPVKAIYAVLKVLLQSLAYDAKAAG